MQALNFLCRFTQGSSLSSPSCHQSVQFDYTQGVPPKGLILEGFPTTATWAQLQHQWGMVGANDRKVSNRGVGVVTPPSPIS